MADKGQASSMTSVTEEDLSADSETDTTESSYSNVTSSMLSSTDTDDKLTPGLISISISKTTSGAADGVSESKSQLKSKSRKAPADGAVMPEYHEAQINKDCIDKNAASIGDEKTGASTQGINFVHPYGSNPLPLECAGHEKKRRNKQTYPFYPPFNPGQRQPFVKQNSGKFCNENLGVSDTGSSLSTDFSDTSSIQRNASRINNNDFHMDSNEEDSEEGSGSGGHKRPLLPDWSSDRWYQARCFDQYWNNYNLVMEWYHLHIQAVKTVQEQMINAWGHPQVGAYSQLLHQPHAKRNRRSRKTSRHRRGTKSRSRQRKEAAGFVSDDKIYTRNRKHASRQDTEPGYEEDDEELEMEITKEMLDFFATSYKHKLERDKAGEQGLTSLAPTEQPGARRKAEMKELYGTGAPMIQGMETAMQMTFDRFSDRFQPSLWPNMPIKISFGK